MRTIAVLAAGAVVVAGLASGCGGGEAASTSSTAALPGTISADAVACEGTPRVGVALDPGAVACVDNGFEPRADVFAFANWGGIGSMDASGMVAMFGPEAVCAQQADDGCVLFPAAQAWLDQVNQAMAGGRCEGMAVVAARLEEGGASVSSLQDGAQATVDLKQETKPVVEEIEYWWATQMVPEVASPTAQVRALQPSEVVATLIQGLRAGAGYTLGMYANGSGHAVTPFAVSQSPDGTFDIAIYDNNDPTAISHLMVDPGTQTWTYDQAAINPTAEAAVWTGTGPGTLDLTAMDWRSGPFAAPFSDAQGDSAKGEATRTFLVTAGIAPGEASVGAQISAGGITVDTTAGLGEVLALPEGVVVTPVKAQTRGRGTVVGVQVTAPSSAGAISVSPRVLQAHSTQSGGQQARRILAQVSVDAPGQPRVSTFGEASGNEASFDVTSGADGSTQVQAKAGAKVLMSIATGRRSLTLAVPASGRVAVIEGEEGIADVRIEDPDGEEVDLTLDGNTDGEVVDLVASLADGEWSVEEWSADGSAPWEDDAWYAGDDSGGHDSGGDAGGGDAGSGDSGSGDSGGSDSGGNDAGSTDSGGNDAGGHDSGSGDAAGGDSGGGDSGGGDSGGGDSGGGDSGGGD